MNITRGIFDLASRAGRAAANRSLKGTASLLTNPFRQASRKVQSWFRGPGAEAMQPLQQLAGRLVEPRLGAPPVVPAMVPQAPDQRQGAPPLPRLRYSPSTQMLRDLALDILSRHSINEIEARQLADRVMGLLRSARFDPAVEPDSRRALEDILVWLEHRFQPPAAPPTTPAAPAQEDEDDVTVFGRADINRWTDQQIRDAQQGEIFTPQSSNVFSYFWVSNSPMGRSASAGVNGTLFVTFKAWYPGQHGKRPNVAGPCYAYSNVNLREYQSFDKAADSSPGGAVWDYLRVRGSRHGHQHPYRIVAGVTIPEGGTYVPRKVVSTGLARRALYDPRSGMQWSTLPREQYPRVNEGDYANYSYRQWQDIADARNAAAGRPVVDRGRPSVNRGRP